MALFPPTHMPPGPIGGPSTMPEEHRSEETYNDAFPSLGGSSNGGLKLTATRPARAANSNTKSEVLKIAVEERRHDDHDSLLRAVKDIQDRSGAKIDVSVSKDHSLTLIINGRPEHLSKARQMISQQLTKEASLRVRVAKEFHRYILGPKGATLTRIEKETGTQIRLPRADDQNADTIAITGSKEGLHKAARSIQHIVDEQSKTDRRVLQIPQQFHDLLPTKEICERVGGNVKVHMPPKAGNVDRPVDRPDELVVTGDREPVGKVAEELTRLYESKKKNCKTLNLTIAKPKHKYIIGPRGSSIQEIFTATGVAIKVPPAESDSDQVTLFGESDKIGLAVSMVLQKADSSNRVEVPSPGWLQRYLKPTTDSVKAECPKVHIDFATTADHITIEGPTQDVDRVEKIFREATTDLLKRLKYAEIKVNPKHFRHLIGAGGSKITQLRSETGVNIIFPDEKNEKQSDIIRIEGDVQQVEVARRKLMEVVTRIENEKSKEVSIEKRYHRFLIAKKAKLVEQFPEVYISFPKQEEKSDIVEIRGNKNEVEKAAKTLQKLYEDVKAENYEVPVNVMKQFHKRIIGKNGTNVAKIREQTHVEIDLPPANSDSQKIIVRGRKENVEKAIVLIEEIQRTFENMTEAHVEIPHKFHEALIGPRGAGVHAIQQECENVLVRFPGDKDKGSDKILLVGPKEEVEVARKMLIERANDVKETSYSEELRIKPEYHRYLIGKKGAKVRQIYQETKARVVFPDSESTGEDAEIVVIIGREAEVKKARKLIDQQVKLLEETKEETVTIEPKYHKHFVGRRAMLINAIQSECGGVRISFPSAESHSSEVSVKGPKECVAEAVKRMLEEVDKMEKIITIEVQIAAKHRRSLLGREGTKTFNIMKEHDVNILFPPPTGGKNAGGRRGEKENGDKEHPSRETSSPDDSSLTTTTEGAEGHANEGSTAEHSPVGAEGQEQMMTVKIVGLEENCHAARDALLAQIPIVEELQIPHDYHRSLIGTKGAAIREIMDKYDVNVSFPDPNQKSDTVRVTGAQMNVDQATVALQERVKQLDADKEDRVLRSFKLSVNVNPLLQRKLINRGWYEANRIMKKFDVNLLFPPRQGQAEDEIVIQGYEAKCHEARDEIVKVTGPIESQFVLDFPIDRRLIGRLLGNRGRKLQEIMDQFKVEIIIPQGDKGTEESVMVQIVGPEDDIYLCRSHLEVYQEDALLDMPPPKKAGEEENNARRGASGRQHAHFQLPNGEAASSEEKSPSKGKGKSGPGYVLKDAPWSAGGGRAGDHKNTPDIGSSHDFPAFLPGQNGHNGVIGSSGWGPRG